MQNKMNKGFTLIELLIVIAIIGVLAVALLPTLTGGPAKARDAARTTAVNSLATAVENYNLDEGSYPDQAGCINPTVGDGIAADLEEYFKQGVPTDPTPDNPNTVGGTECTGQYYYNILKDGNGRKVGYAIVAGMETERSNNAALSDDAPEWDLEGVQAAIDAEAPDDGNTHFVHYSK